MMPSVRPIQWIHAVPWMDPSRSSTGTRLLLAYMLLWTYPRTLPAVAVPPAGLPAGDVGPLHSPLRPP